MKHFELDNIATDCILTGTLKSKLITLPFSRRVLSSTMQKIVRVFHVLQKFVDSF